MILKHLLIIHLFFILSLGFSQDFLNNVLANQRTDGSKIVDIAYDLTDGEFLISYTISLEVSTDGGASYQVLTYGCTGDIGANRDSGSKSIFWDLNLQYDDKYLPDAKIRVKATFLDRTSTNETLLFTIDTRDPEITILYPNGGEHFPDYNTSMVEIGWTAYDETDHGELVIGAYISFELGGWFVPIDTVMENMGYTNLDLSVDGSVPERLWGKLKMTATDFYGNQSVDYSDHYFILGNPQGDMQAQSMDVSTSQVLLDWSWQEDQLIVFQTGALSFLTGGDEFAILDNAGIPNEYCQGGYGVIELASLTYSTEMSINPTALKANAGVDNCEQGGGRYPGYIRGSPIIFQATYGDGNQGFEDYQSPEELEQLHIVKGSARIETIQERIATLRTSEERVLRAAVKRRKNASDIRSIFAGLNEYEIVEPAVTEPKKFLNLKVGDLIIPKNN